MSRWIAGSSVTAVVLAGCSLLTDLSGLDTGSAVGADGGGSSSSASSASGGTPPPDGNASSSTTSTSSTSSTSSSSSSSGAVPDASPDAPPACTLTTTDSLLPSTVGATGLGAPWVVPDNAKNEDGLATTTSLTKADDQSATLLLSNFSFNVPTTAQIRGVTVTIRAKATASTVAKDVRDEAVRLAPNGGMAGTTLKGFQDEWSSSYTNHTAGGPTATWGLTLTPAIINGPTFGVGYVTRFHADLAGDTASLDLDAVRVSVTYCN